MHELVWKANRELWNSAARPTLLLKWALCGALLSGLILSPKLWMTERTFPTIPAVPGLPDLPQVVCILLFGMLFIAVGAVALTPNPGRGVYVIPAIGAVLVLFDITRLQPWFYQYMLMFLALGLMIWDDPESRRSRAAWAICALIMASLYFWSGVQKANMSFVDSVFPWLLGPMAEKLRPIAFAVPVIEALVGLSLLLPRSRALGLIGACIMHGLMMIVLGPFGHNFNPIVWPWNLWMLVFALVLFFRNPLPMLFHAWSTPLGKAIVVVVAALPALSFADLWDDYVSASLYSGRSRNAWILLTEDGRIRLPVVPDKALEQTGDTHYRLNISLWALSELNVPPYPEMRVYGAIAGKLRKAGIPAKDMKMLVTSRPGLTSSSKSFIAVPIR